jgi:hypothetical protein
MANGTPFLAPSAHPIAHYGFQDKGTNAIRANSALID